jgi:hypothetical protein
MKNLLDETIEKGSWSDRRLIMYLMGLKGAPGMLFKDYGKEGSNRLNSLNKLVNKGLIKITHFDGEVIYFNFSGEIELKKISVSFGSYL